MRSGELDMTENYVIACVVIAIFAIRELTFLYREKTWNAYRDQLSKEHRVKEAMMLNRLFTESAHEYAVLNDQTAKIEDTILNPMAARVSDDPTETVNDLLEKAGLGDNGYSNGGVSVV